MNKNILLVVLLLIILVGIFALTRDREQDIVDSFEKCAQAGYPIMESYPARCATPDGQTFTQIIDELIAESGGTITGTVLFGPTCPVMQDPPESECADRFYATELVLTSVDGSRVIKGFSSDSDGQFNIDVPPGEYAVRSAGTNIIPQCGTPTPIIVKANDSIDVTVHCDSGIR